MQLDSQDTKKYHRTKLLVSLLGTLLFLGYAGMWALWGGEPILSLTTNRWGALLVFAACFGFMFEFFSTPLNYYVEFVIEHRYDLSNQDFSRWLSQLAKGWLIGGVIGGIVLAGLYSLLWYGGDWWWLWVWCAWIGLTVVLAQLFPILLLPIFHKSKVLDDDKITDSLTRMAGESSLKLDGIYSLDLSTDTKAANAMLTGLGSTRRVYLSDTLLDTFAPKEIDVVFAHELGHHTRGHIWKTLALSALFGTLHIGVLAHFLHHLRGPDGNHAFEAIAALPAIALWLCLLDLTLKPIHNAISRHFERQCDSDALRRTQDPEAYRSAFRRLAELNLADPDPHPLIEWYFHDHPAMSKRLAVADQPARE